MFRDWGMYMGGQSFRVFLKIGILTKWKLKYGIHRIMPSHLGRGKLYLWQIPYSKRAHGNAEFVANLKPSLIEQPKYCPMWTIYCFQPLFMQRPILVWRLTGWITATADDFKILSCPFVFHLIKVYLVTKISTTFCSMFSPNICIAALG